MTYFLISHTQDINQLLLTTGWALLWYWSSRTSWRVTLQPIMRHRASHQRVIRYSKWMGESKSKCHRLGSIGNPTTSIQIGQGLILWYSGPARLTKTYNHNWQQNGNLNNPSMQTSLFRSEHASVTWCLLWNHDCGAANQQMLSRSSEWRHSHRTTIAVDGECSERRWLLCSQQFCTVHPETSSACLSSYTPISSTQNIITILCYRAKLY